MRNHKPNYKFAPIERKILSGHKGNINLVAEQMLIKGVPGAAKTTKVLEILVALMVPPIQGSKALMIIQKRKQGNQLAEMPGGTSTPHPMRGWLSVLHRKMHHRFIITFTGRHN